MVVVKASSFTNKYNVTKIKKTPYFVILVWMNILCIKFWLMNTVQRFLKV